MKPIVKKFTKASPCTKLDIWNCFVADTGLPDLTVQVDEAHSVIGLNVPRVMERNGRLVKTVAVDGVTNHPIGADYYELTDNGKVWLYNGAKAYIRNHPVEARSARVAPRSTYPGTGAAKKRLRPIAGRISRRRPT